MANTGREAPLLENIDPSKREFIGRLTRASAFVAPLVASFSMASVGVAEAAPLNGSLSG